MAKDSLAQPSDSIPSWGRQLQFARKELGLTREQFAARANISAAAVRAYETGRRNASRAQVEKLVAALEIDRGWGNRILVAARWHYDVTWRHAQGRMRFRGVVSTANEREGLAFNDWIPLDAETWLALERAKACPPQASNGARPRPLKRGRR